MFIDTRAVPNDQRLECDICIIGAGAAGISIAREFLSGTRKICILESGDIHYNSDTQSLYDGIQTGLPNFSLMSSRLRFFGGATNHWYGHCRPFKSYDFIQRDWIPHSGWPITYNDLAPFYKRAADLLRLPVKVWDIDFVQRLIGEPYLPFDKSKIFTKSSIVKPVRMGQAFHDEFSKSENIQIYLNANATELETDTSARQVTGVRVATLTGNKVTVKAKQYVLASGGIENARILLLSNRVMNTGLGNEHDLVGRYFMDHPRFQIGMIQLVNSDMRVRLYGEHQLRGATTSVTLSISEKTQERLRISANGIALKQRLDWSSWSAKTHRLFKSMFGNDSSGINHELCAEDVSNLLGDIQPSKPSMATRLRRKIPTKHINCYISIEPIPNPDSRVKLCSTRDQLGLQQTDLDWRLTELDLQNAKKTAQLLGKEVGRAGIGRLKSYIEDKGTWEDFQGSKPHLLTNWHHMGTTRMANDPAEGVVDSDCKIHGLSNLYVAGSSVFPTGGSGPPTLTILALSIRLADHLKKAMI